MISKSRSFSIRTVHFKRQLSFSTTACLTRAPQHSQSQKINTTSQFHRLGGAQFETLDSRLSFCSNALKRCAKMGSLRGSKQLHAHLIRSAHFNALQLQNQLFNAYAKCKQIGDVFKVFDEMPVRNIVAWNTLISGIANCGGSLRSCLQLGLNYFARMLCNKVSPDHITFVCLLRVCVELNNIAVGKQLHSMIVKFGFSKNCFVNSSLIDLYAKFGEVSDARCVFDHVFERDLVLWNVMVSCYALNCLVDEAFRVFNLMNLEGIAGDDFTYTSLLNCSSTLRSGELGSQIHGIVIKMCFDIDVVVASALVDMYAKGENIFDARQVFDEMIIKNRISWTTMIVAYGKNGDGKEAMKLLLKMLEQAYSPDEVALASVLSSCGNLSSLIEVIQVHAYLMKHGFSSFLSVGNALINAYSKCGAIALASLCFGSISEPDIVTWTSMIGAYAFHGLAKESTELFEKMLLTGTKPDQIAFLGVLSACSHAGLVKQGLHYFNLMTNVYKILPDFEHYTCLVDLLGKLGFLNEASDVLISMPIGFCSDSFGAFVSACELHGNVGLAKWGAEKLFELEPNKALNYAVVSNVFASHGDWFDVARVREAMSERCCNKVPGCSWMEISG